MPKRWTDVTGQQFGALTVLNCDLQPPNRALVRCSCNHEFAANISNLVQGKMTSCGSKTCSTRGHNLLNRVFGDLTVIEASPSNKRGDRLWICNCTCGSTKRIRGTHLLAGLTSCGCKTSVQRSQKLRKSPREKLIKAQMYAYKASAIARGLQFNLTAAQLESLLFAQCAYCHVEPYAIYTKVFIDGSQESIAWNGIDRVDSTKGYIIENCVTCCKICNRAKSDATPEEWHAWLQRIKQS